MSALNLELAAFWLALLGYTAATVIALFRLVFRRDFGMRLFALLASAWALQTVALAVRWVRLGHLPVLNVFEMLAANLWGLMGAVLAGYWLLPRLRPITAILLPVVMLVMAWMLVVPKFDSSLPATYYTLWLYIHIAFIKIFLGCAFVAVGIATVVLIRSYKSDNMLFSRLPETPALDQTAYKCMALAMIFDTLGVLSGAIWAQDAWGRYWQWDPLETWAFLTWLSVGLTLHVRASFKPPFVTNAWMIVGTFLVAWLTFFGIPFVSKSLHQGAI